LALQPNVVQPGEAALAVVLRNENWNVVVQPGVAGSLQRCEFDGAAIMQPVAGVERIGCPPLSCCYFPMIPFANRIENGRFEFSGRNLQLAANTPGTPHAMHGHGWLSAWYVTHASRSACAMAFVHEPAHGWPWRYEGTQSFEISGDQLRIVLGVRNLSSSEMPCGLGFHPYLADRDDASLQFEARHLWNGSAAEFPRERIAVPREFSFATGANVAERVGTDHCYEGWSRSAVVRYAKAPRAIVIEGCEATGFVIVYAPGRGYFCVEPVTHAVNAPNLATSSGTGFWTLEPGERRQIAMLIRVMHCTG
jgi:aldose 1-epimerase